MSISKSALLKVAAEQIGVYENPAGSNKVRYNTWFYSKAVSGKAYPWCASFVSWVFWQARYAKGVLKTASTVLMAKDFAKRGLFTRGAKGIRAGDVVFYAFNGPSYKGRWLGIHHCGIVESVGADYIIAIEGNTSRRSADNGGTVMRVKRSKSNVAGYGRPAYSPEPKKVSKVKHAKVKTNGSNLVMRKVPSAKGKLVGRIPNGKQVTLVNKGKSWDEIQYGNLKGFVFNKWLKY